MEWFVEQFGVLGLVLPGATLALACWQLGYQRCLARLRARDMQLIGDLIEEELRDRCADILRSSVHQREMYGRELTRWQQFHDVSKSDEAKRYAMQQLRYWQAKIERLLDEEETHRTLEQQKRIEAIIAGTLREWRGSEGGSRGLHDEILELFEQEKAPFPSF